MPIIHTTPRQARRTLDHRTDGGSGHIYATGSFLGRGFCPEISDCLSLLPEWEKLKYTLKLSQQNSKC